MTSETKTIMLGDFEKRDTEYLSKLIAEELADEGINPESFAFHIEVEYKEKGVCDNQKSAVANRGSAIARGGVSVAVTSY